MKIEELKKILKEVVKEVIQDELRDILLEAIKYSQPIQETTHPTYQATPTSTNNTDVRTSYLNILNETANPPKQGEFIPNPNAALGQGSLGEGELGMDEIMKLMNG